MKSKLTLLALVAVIASLPRTTDAQQLAPLPPLNQPFVCPDGLTYIVESCQPWGSEERCIFRSERNGAMENHANTWRSMLSEKLKNCKAAGTQAQPSRPNPGAQTTGAQNMDSSYLTKLPSVERVMREVQGKDPIDTAAKQAGAFWQLRNIIIHMALNMRRNENNLMPDEQRIGNEYYAAWSKLWQAVTQQVKDGPTQFKLQGYTMDGAFLEEILQRLCAPGFRDEYWQSSEPINSRIRQRLEEDKALARQAEEARNRPDNLPPQSQQKPWQRELSRCLASGRSESQCMTEALSKGMDDFVGMKKTPRPAGIYLGGTYRGAGGFAINFGANSATIGCKEVGAHAGYTLDMNGNQLVIKILSGATWDASATLPGMPKPPAPTEDFQGQRIVLPIRPDGRLAATRISPQPSTTVKVTGSVTVGYKQGTQTITETDRNGYTTTRYVPIQVPITETRTTQCELGLLTLDPASSGSGPDVGIGTAAVGAFLSVSDPKAIKPIPPGFRLHGKYTGADGFDIEFYPENALVSCREAIIARDYSVALNGNRVMVNMQNGASPITLEFKPDATLAGSGPVQVSSRRVVGVKQRIEGTRNVQEPIFEPITDTCTLGVLVPSGSARPGTAIPAGSTTSADTAAPDTTANAPSAPAGMGSLLVILQLPTREQTTSHRGGFFMLGKESLETALRRSGVGPTPGGTAIMAWTDACKKKQPLCQQGSSGIGAISLGQLAFDASMKFQTKPLPVGTYYVIGSAEYNEQVRVWNLRVDLKPGANSITVSESNAAVRN
jgi:hypothetical protein